MKARILTLAMMVILFVACKSSDSPNSNYLWTNRTNIAGQLHYTANPFNPLGDSVLCLKNVREVCCVTYTDDTYSKVMEILSKYDGVFDEGTNPAPRNNNHVLFLPSSDMYFYPIRDKHFISITNAETSDILPFVKLLVVIEESNHIHEDFVTIYTSPKGEEDSNSSQSIYIGDYVIFEGDDRMQDIFLSDTITSNNNYIICFDGYHGPISYTTSKK